MWAEQEPRGRDPAGPSHLILTGRYFPPNETGTLARI
jgi:hypothetical protein